MNKQEIIEAIKEANKDVETVRRTLLQIDKERSDRWTFEQRFTTDLAYRNGLVHALLLSGECDNDDMAYLRTLYNKPAIWSHLLGAMPE